MITFLEAALVVLKEAGEPLTSREISRRAVESGLLATTGKTPEASMSAVLYTEAGTEQPRIVRLSRPGATRAARGSVRWALADVVEPSDDG